MEVIKDESFGVVPVIQIDGDWKVLLVHQISYRGKNDRFWTFPKGHADDGESPLETASRELLEETGITDVQIIESASFPVAYSFKHEGKRVEKTVTYYLGICAQTDYKITLPNEIAAVSWCTFSEAETMLVHDTAKEVLEAAKIYLSNSKI